ncbi:hypothetical protein [Streptomyces sp. NBC_01262]|uniref:hypothetical protein n=1 Tax=Streptomyces sp. NBC_01262 TaxID=2903803 RepID=UPI002E32B66B|nr:hypothetical protein [Streptomyces sp. NBC_01262]
MSAEATGRRVEEVLDRLGASGDAAVNQAAEELVRVLMDLYGTGLARVVELVGDETLDALLADELVTGLLVLHDLHPEDTRTRVGRALTAAGAADATVLHLDEASGTLRLRTGAESGGGCGCGSADSTQQRIDDAVSAYAPEITHIEVEQAEPAAREPVLLQIGRGPGAS